MVRNYSHRLIPGLCDSFGNLQPGAFVCRYPYCLRATWGFDSPKQRDAHEATHEQKFRCAYTSCVSFSTGFATRRALKRHNETYHTTVNSHSSLSETISRIVALPRLLGLRIYQLRGRTMIVLALLLLAMSLRHCVDCRISTRWKLSSGLCPKFLTREG